MKGFLAFPVLLLLLFSIPAVADYDDGLAAFEKGDYATAMKEWKPLAEMGDVQAQNNLGSMFARGEGATQDYKAEFKWYK